MTIKVFSHYYGGWYQREVNSLDDVLDILEQDEGSRLPEAGEINKRHRDHMYTWRELVERLTGITLFD